MGIVYKIIGGLTFFVGLIIIFGYPFEDQKLQMEGTVKGAILFGIILMGIGVYLMTI